MQLQCQQQFVCRRYPVILCLFTCPVKCIWSQITILLLLVQTSKAVWFCLISHRLDDDSIYDMVSAIGIAGFWIERQSPRISAEPNPRSFGHEFV